MVDSVVRPALQRSAPFKRKSGCVTNRGTKVLAVGDLHGDFKAAIRVLNHTGVLAVDAALHRANLGVLAHNRSTRGTQPLRYDAYSWRFGNNMVVQTGDLFDRGLNSKELIELWIWLGVEAAKDQGQVVNLLGNHELLQYQDPMKLLHRKYDVGNDSMSYGDDVRKTWKAHRAGNLHTTTGKYGRWIASLPVVVYETTTKTLFSHGCLSSKWAQKGVEAMNDDAAALLRGVEAPSKAVEAAFGREESVAYGGDVGRDSNRLSDDDGPLWNRLYANAVRVKNWSLLRTQVNAALEAHGEASRMVCGHTITRSEEPEQYVDGKIWFIDVAMTEGYGAGARWGAVLIERGRTTARAYSHLDSLRSTV